MRPLEVYADVRCPFAHAAIHQVLAHRLDRVGPVASLAFHAWPLERLDPSPTDVGEIAAEVAGLRRTFPDRFVGFDPATFPSTSLPAFALCAAARRVDAATGEAVAIEVRNRLWERGEDVSDPDVLAAVAEAHGIEVTDEDRASVARDHEAGAARGVIGSPHFFSGDAGFFCPTFSVARISDGEAPGGEASRGEAPGYTAPSDTTPGASASGSVGVRFVVTLDPERFASFTDVAFG